MRVVVVRGGGGGGFQVSREGREGKRGEERASLPHRIGRKSHPIPVPSQKAEGRTTCPGGRGNPNALTLTLVTMSSWYMVSRGSLADHNFSLASGRKNWIPVRSNIQWRDWRTRTFPAFPSCGELPVFPEVPFSGPVAPRLDTFKAMRWPRSLPPPRRAMRGRCVLCFV